MKQLVIILTMLFGVSIGAQSIEKFSIDSGGQSVSNGGINLLYSIGETHVREINTGNIWLSEGFINSFDSTTLGVSEYEIATVKIYPNPTSGAINVSTNLEISKLELFDVTGKSILVNKSTKILKLNTLHSGTYFLRIHTLNRIFTKKVLLSK